MVEWSISVGNIAEIVSIVAGGMFFVATNRTRLNGLSLELGSIQHEIVELRKVVINQAVQAEQIKSLLARVDLLDRRMVNVRESLPR